MTRLWLFLPMLLPLLAGCTRVQYVPVESRRDSVYIDRLVPYPVPADSATIRALVECDERGKVVLRWLDMANSRNVDLQFKLDSLGHVIADMRIKKDTLYLPSREIYVDRDVEVPVPVEKQLTKWQQVKINYGGKAIGLLAVAVSVAIYYGLRRYKILK